MANRLIYQAKLEVPNVPATGPTTPTTYGWYSPLTEPVIRAKVIYNQPAAFTPPTSVPVNPTQSLNVIEVYYRTIYDNVAY